MPLKHQALGLSTCCNVYVYYPCKDCFFGFKALSEHSRKVEKNKIQERSFNRRAA